jgi:hypothetical protein
MVLFEVTRLWAYDRMAIVALQTLVWIVEREPALVSSYKAEGKRARAP